MKQKNIHWYHVCDVGKLFRVGAGDIWKFGLSSLNPPGGNCDDPVTNCSNRANSSWENVPTIVQNHLRIYQSEGIDKIYIYVLKQPIIMIRSLTFLKQRDESVAIQLDFISLILIFPIPHISNWKEKWCPLV